MNCVGISVIVICLLTENAIGGSVFIYNNLSGKNNLLKVHCKSGDNDEGYHVRRRGGLYHFSFSDHIMDKTHIWCHLWQGFRYEHYVVIVAYDAGTLRASSNWVRWSVRDYGVYQSINNETFQFRYNWDGEFT
ncbi:putative S-protein1 [Cardamine amara subsp. amara]|uniref:S-protein homolog n=1 Tax=Cardamine amara subsp. amara TaxID=228776 RepID=A0ABD0YZL7_CARAN